MSVLHRLFPREHTDLRGKVVVITGAGSGIGRALAVVAAGRGARLALSDVDLVGLGSTAARCRALGAEVLEETLDVRDRNLIRAHAESVVEHFGQVNVVINNAGVALGATAERMSEKDLDWVLDVDLHGVIDSSQIFLPHLIASGEGHLVNISSVFGLIPVPSQSAYNAAKYGVRGYTESVSMELRASEHDVWVLCVHPGGIRTNIARNARTEGGDARSIAESFDRVARMEPMRAAQIIIGAVERRQRRVLVGADAWALHTLQMLGGVGWQMALEAVSRRLLSKVLGDEQDAP